MSAERDHTTEVEGWLRHIALERAQPGKQPQITIGAYWGMIEDVAREARQSALAKLGASDR